MNINKKGTNMKANQILDEIRSTIAPEKKLQMELSVAIANRIYDILEKKGMSQKEFAQLMGKTETEVSRWLSGTQNLTMATICKISVALGEDLIRVGPATHNLLMRQSRTTEVSEEPKLKLNEINAKIRAAKEERSMEKVRKIERVQDDDAIVHLIEMQVYWDKGFSVDSIANACDINFSDKYPDMTMEDWKKIINDYQILIHQSSAF